MIIRSMGSGPTSYRSPMGNRDLPRKIDHSPGSFELLENKANKNFQMKNRDNKLNETMGCCHNISAVD